MTKDATAAHHAMIKGHHSGHEVHIKHLREHGQKVQDEEESSSEKKIEKMMGEKKAEEME
jgi:hypothetical protein